MKFNAIIVEDEPLLARMLRRMIEEINPDCQIVAELTGVEDTVAWLNANPEPCLIFMDIQLSDGICFSIFDAVDVSNKGIVFTTAYDEYVMNAFEYNSLAYLLKPVKPEDLRKVFDKIGNIAGTFEAFNQLNGQKKYGELARLIEQMRPRYRKRIMVTKVDGYVQLAVDDVAFFKVEEKVTLAYTFSGQVHAIDFSLEKLEEELYGDSFFRANRQYIVNIEAIKQIESYFGGKLILKLNTVAAEKIIVSRKKANIFKKWLDR